jgi:hypothetical protein
MVADMNKLLSNLPGAGLVSGPLAWGLSTQANYSLTTLFCRHQAAWVLLLGALVLANFSLAGAWVSIHSAPVAPSSQNSHPRHFLSVVGTASGILFAGIICLQGAAAFALNGCER